MRYLVLLMFCFLFVQPAFALKLTTTAFENGKNIPEKYTCNAQDLSPALSWSEVPEDTQSFVLICEDPTAPLGDWVHWVVYNIPANATTIEEGLAKNSILYDGIAQGMNDFGKIGYNGPCPPAGKPHQYAFTLYAVDTRISVSTRSVTKKDITEALRGHVIEEVRITGSYEAPKGKKPVKSRERMSY
jgi:Raf kinase inhibitor-like YbhB/YbcL family protein